MACTSVADAVEAAAAAAARATVEAGGTDGSGTVGSVAADQAVAKSTCGKGVRRRVYRKNRRSKSRGVDYTPQDDSGLCNVCMKGNSYKSNPLKRCCRCEVPSAEDRDGGVWRARRFATATCIACNKQPVAYGIVIDS